MRYEKLGSETDAGSAENLLSEETYYRAQPRSWLWTILNGVVFCASLGFFTVGYLQTHPSELEMMKRTSFYCESTAVVTVHG